MHHKPIFIHASLSYDKKISWYISLGRSYNSLPEWYGGGAVPTMIAYSGKYG